MNRAGARLNIELYRKLLTGEMDGFIRTDQRRRLWPLLREQVVAMSDLYFKAIQEQWPNIRALYITYGSEKPIILYDIDEQKIYAYPYKEFKAELSKKSQASLEHDYKSASTFGSMVVFVRDNIKRKLVSYTMSTDLSGAAGPDEPVPARSR
jgi:hypothetical protein